jgi:hypothetical protein
MFIPFELLTFQYDVKDDFLEQGTKNMSFINKNLVLVSTVW